MGKLWTKEETALLKTLYYDHSISESINMFGLDWQHIRSKAKRMGFKRKRVKCFFKPGTNHCFFDIWTEPMSYVLGFIAADGCVAQSKKNWGIKLAEKDLDLLTKIRDLVAPGVNIRKEIRHKDGKIFYYVKFVVFSTY